MSLRRASKPATLEERLVAGALQSSMVKKVLTCYEPRETPEVPNHVKDMAADDGALEDVVNATVAGAPVQTGVKIDTRTDSNLIDIDQTVAVSGTPRRIRWRRLSDGQGRNCVGRGRSA